MTPEDVEKLVEDVLEASANAVPLGSFTDPSMPYKLAEKREAKDALMSAIRSVFAERDALQARLEAAERDTARLNYIERRFHILGFTLGDEWMMVSITDGRTFPTMREAVDASIAQEQGKP